MFDFMNVTRALSDENRVRIIAALNGRELCVCEIIIMLRLSPSTVSKHLSILRNARLLNGRKEGRWMHYSLARDPKRPMVAEAIDWVLRSIGSDAQVRTDWERIEALPAGQGEKKCG